MRATTPKSVTSPAAPAHGRMMAGDSIMGAVATAFPLDDSETTTAERLVVRALVEGRSQEAIATGHGVASRTVSNQVGSAYRKIGVHSRIELLLALQRSALADHQLER